jgi:hypothetical protein
VEVKCGVWFHQLVLFMWHSAETKAKKAVYKGGRDGNKGKTEEKPENDEVGGEGDGGGWMKKYDVLGASKGLGFF